MDIKTLAKKPTFRDLLNILSEMPEEHLDDNLTIYDAEIDEFIPIESIGEVFNSDVIENGCMVFSMPDLIT